MSINTDDFIDSYVQRLKDDGVEFPTFEDPETGDDIDGEELMRDGLERLALDLFGHKTHNLLTLTSTTTLSEDVNTTVLADASGGLMTITLPSVADMVGKTVVVKKTDSSGNTVTVSSTSNIDGNASYSLTAQNQVVKVISDGSTYWITS